MPYDLKQLSRHESEALRALPGPDYYSALEWVHEARRPDTYIEIGVRAGASLAIARCETTCIGIDPAAQIAAKLSPRTQIYEMTSDAFFATHTPKEAIGRDSFDFAFIDGLHLFEQTLRDFINLERWAGERSLIAIHDCIPLNAITSQRNRATDFYSGDVWKAVACLKRFRPDLELVTIAAPPTGLCLVAGLDPMSEVLSSLYERIVKEYMSLNFAHYAKHPEIMPPLVANNQQCVFRLCECL